LLFYRSIEGEKEIYTLTDGLQRCSTIRDFVQNPTKYFSLNDVDGEILTSIFDMLNLAGSENRVKEKIKEKITDFVKDELDINDIQYRDFTDFLSNEFPVVNEKTKEITDTIRPFLKKYKEKYDEIIRVSIPAIVYQGDIGNLPEIFDRINQGGTKLSKYQVFAAYWSTKGKHRVRNQSVVKLILDKYDKMIDDGYILKDYDKN